MCFTPIAQVLQSTHSITNLYSYYTYMIKNLINITFTKGVAVSDRRKQYWFIKISSNRQNLQDFKKTKLLIVWPRAL